MAAPTLMRGMHLMRHQGTDDQQQRMLTAGLCADHYAGVMAGWLNHPAARRTKQGVVGSHQVLLCPAASSRGAESYGGRAAPHDW